MQAGAAGGVCHVTAAKETSLVKVNQLLKTALTGRLWQSNSSTPHFFYKDTDDGTLHRIDYDDSQSLKLKYAYAKSVGARGVGMWTASGLDYAGDPAMGKQFWEDLKQFQE